MSTAPPAPPPALAKQTVAQLKAACQQLGIKGYSKWTKAQLIDALGAAGNSGAAALASTKASVPSDATDPSAGVTTPAVKFTANPKAPKRSRTKSSAGSASASAPTADASADIVPPKLKKPRKPKTDAASSLSAPSLQAANVPKPAVESVPKEAPAEPSATQADPPTTRVANGGRDTPPPSTDLMDAAPRTTQPVKPPSTAPKRAPKLFTTKPPKVAAPTVSSKACSAPGKPVVQGRKFAALKAATLPSKATNSPLAANPVWPFSRPSLPDKATVADRVAYMQQHFLERLFTSLNAARDVPPIPPPWSGSTYIASTLAFQGFHPRIYELDNATFLVAVRWWVARLYTLLQLGSGEDWSAGAGAMGILGPDMATWPAAVECRRIAGDIYLVVTETQERNMGSRSSEEPDSGKKRKRAKVKSPPPATTTRYIALGATGDVLGSSTDATTAEDVVEGFGVRADWAAYIRALATSTGPAPLLALVKTKDAVAAPAGIRKAWRTRAEIAGDIASLAVAERAVLASCSMNSYSGTKLSAAQMDAEWLSHTADLGVSQRAPRASFTTADKPFPPRGVDAPATPRKVELYLPEPLQVLSVHMLPNTALAQVHRASGKSDYVLADTGHPVGDEDGGVVPLWQGLLSCGARGEYKAQGTFWDGWQARVRSFGEA